jgi:4-oxalocrotonate tautomerase
MPFVNVKLIEGVFDADQKREIIERLTDTMVGIEGENMREVTWVVVDPQGRPADMPLAINWR